MKPNGYLDGHIGDLILWSFCVLALIAFTITVMAGHSDQTLGNVLMAALGALGGYMTKRIAGNAPTTTNVDMGNVDTANVTPGSLAESVERIGHGRES